MVTPGIGFMTRNWGIKLAAAALAITLWMGVRASEPDQANLPGIPVEVDVRDPDWRLAADPEPATLRVTVLGPTGELLRLASNPPRIILPVERVYDARETQIVPLQWVRLPGDIPGTRVVALTPDTIRLQYERLVARTLPVRVRTDGVPPDGLRLDPGIDTRPAVLEVRGPARLLDRLDSVPLLPVDISRLRSTTTVPTPVDTVALQGLTVTPGEVTVILRVQADTAGRDSARPRPLFE